MEFSLGSAAQKAKEELEARSKKAYSTLSAKRAQMARLRQVGSRAGDSPNSPLVYALGRACLVSNL